MTAGQRVERRKNKAPNPPRMNPDLAAAPHSRTDLHHMTDGPSSPSSPANQLRVRKLRRKAFDGRFSIGESSPKSPSPSRMSTALRLPPCPPISPLLKAETRDSDAEVFHWRVRTAGAPRGGRRGNQVAGLFISLLVRQSAGSSPTAETRDSGAEVFHGRLQASSPPRLPCPAGQSILPGERSSLQSPSRCFGCENESREPMSQIDAKIHQGLNPRTKKSAKSRNYSRPPTEMQYDNEKCMNDLERTIWIES